MAYLPLSTANLPDPAINPAQGSSPEDYFNTVTYNGNSSNPASVTGVGFQPDFVWVKTRSFGNTNHRLQDVVRGSNKRVMSDLTSAEIDTAGGIQSFDSDGFTVGDGTSKDGFIHFGGRTFVAWNWKANGSGVSNTDGLTPSTVSANTESGFSIVSYEGTGSATTVGHGLNSTPEMVIFKSRTLAANWVVVQSMVGNPVNGDYILLNGTSGLANSANVNTTLGNSFITLDVLNWYNGSGDDIIAYYFHSVEGFSKFGSYSGTDSADGPFIYTGFRPSLVIVKCTTNADDWCILDSERDSYNVADALIKANGADAELEYTSLDMLSNGFKLRVTNSYRLNKGGASFIYMAFAENPFKYSNAR